VRAGSAAGIVRVPWRSLRMDPRPEVQGELEPISFSGRVDIEPCQTLVNTRSLIAYLLLALVEGKATKGRGPARRAKELLQLVTSLPSRELEAPCAGDTVVISARGVSASIGHDGFIFCQG